MPVVARPHGGIPLWVGVACAALAAIALFTFLDNRRRALEAPTVRARAADAIDLPPPPPLLLVPPLPPEPVIIEDAAPVVPAPAPVVPQPRPLPLVEKPINLPPITLDLPTPAARGSSGPTLVIDNSAPRSEPASGAAAPAPSAAGADTAVQGGATGRARAGMFANRSTTVIQGTLIPAVLETGFDSTRPGFARAIISRDVRGFDGTRVLIPRGSRLIGEYGSSAATGQKRAAINWTRLIRPDGVTIAVGSPATDTLGRGGVRAKVDTHFLERFSGAILQSVLDIGVNVAASRIGNPVIVAVPGSLTGSNSQIVQPPTAVPTLTVPPGRSISVFVARDLDFTGPETARE